MKKLVIISIIIGVILGIYFLFKDNKILYLNIGDDTLLNAPSYSKEVITYLKENNKYENYIDYVKGNYRITDFIKDIDENKIIENDRTIKNLLIKADIITIWVGMNDIYYKMPSHDSVSVYNYLDEVLVDSNEFFQLLRKNSKEPIIFVGSFNILDYSKEEYFEYFNQRVQDLCEKYDIDFIDTNHTLTKEDVNDRKLTKSGSKILGNRIKEIIKIRMNK